MKCQFCPEYHNGRCNASGNEKFSFPVAPDSDCALERIAQEAERNEEMLPGDEPAEDGAQGGSERAGKSDLPEFFGTEQDTEKLGICRHIGKMADAVVRAAPNHIRAKCSDPNDNTQYDWTLSLDLHSPAVVVSEIIRKRLCEMLLAANQVKITAVPGKNITRFSFIVTDLWKE